MTDDRSKKQITDETVAQWMRSQPKAEADGDFRDRLRAAFVSGEIEGEAHDAGTEAPAPTPRRRRIPLWRWLVPAAVAFAALAVILLNPGPALEVIDVSGSGGPVVVNGKSMTEKAAISAALAPGAEVEVPAGTTLDLAMAGTALYEVTGGTRMTLPASPGRWWNRSVDCTIYAGELRLKTGPRFPGDELRVFTPDGIVVVTGTLLSIQCDEKGTCVCVLEGTAHVGVDAEDLQPVPPGMRKVMMRDGTNEIIPVKPMHRDGVLDFDKRLGDRMQ